MSPVLPPLANGDLERAFFRLVPQDSYTREKIAAMLGFTQESISEIPALHPQIKEDTGGLRYPDKGVEEQPARDPMVPQGRSLPAVLRQVRKGNAGKAPKWLIEVEPLEKTENDEACLPSPAPLFAPGQARNILALTISTAREEGAIMVDSIVQAVAKGKALRHIPRAMVPSMAPAVQLLVDRSEAMLPFLADLDQIEEAFEGVFGRMLQVVSFASSPLRKVGQGPRPTWSDYFPGQVPATGTRVVCITDLGIGRPVGCVIPAQPEEWLRFQERLRRHGSSLIVLTPYAPARWPNPLVKRLNILHWDRKTNAARATALIKRVI